MTFQGISKNGKCDLCNVALANASKNEQRRILYYMKEGKIRPCDICGTHKNRYGRMFKNGRAVLTHERWCRERVIKKKK